MALLIGKKKAAKKGYSYTGKGTFVSGFRAFLSDSRAGVFFAALLALLHLANVLFARNNVLQVPLGLAAVLFCPGYLWLDVLSRKASSADLTERLVLSVAVSIGLVVSATTVLSIILKMPLNSVSVALVVSGISFFGLGARKLPFKRV
ncbi:MAG: DUF1616 domain-containing protein [archaeon]